MVGLGSPQNNKYYLDALEQEDSSKVTTFNNGKLEIVFDNLGKGGYDNVSDIARDFTLQTEAMVAGRRGGGGSGGRKIKSDLGDIPKVLGEVTSDWDRLSSNNREAANDLVHLLSDAIFRHKKGGGGGVDLLLTGIESSLWMAEQFAADLKIIFPQINCVAVSSNKLLGALESVPRMVHFCGYNRLRGEDLRADRPVVLCLSQSGQTFATLHATRQLLSILGGNVFLVTGSADSKMRAAVIQSVGAEIGGRRIMCNLSGLRSSEASSVAAVAMHHTLTELLVYLAQIASVGGTDLEINVSKADVIDFRDLTLEINDNARVITRQSSKTNKKLRAQGRLWAQHISESWRVMVISGFYILASVISGYGIFDVIFFAWRDVKWVWYVANTLDALFFIFMPKLWSYILRWKEGRAILARHGKRTLVICDVPWVHKNLGE